MPSQPPSPPAGAPEPRRGAPDDLLPVEQIHASARRPPRPLAVTLLTLAAVLAMNVLAGVLLRHASPNRGYRLIERKWDMLESMSQPVDTLVLGDSTANQGLDTRLISRHFGGRTVNLATIGHMMLLNDAWMLQRYVERFGPPKRVILGHVYDIFQRRSRARHFMLVPAVPSLGTWTVSPPLRLSTRDRVLLLIDRAFPMYSQNDSLATLIRDPSELVRQLRAPGPDAALLGYEPNPGPASAEYVQRNARAHIGAIRRYPGKLSEENRQALDAMSALADQHGFDIYLSVSPVYDWFAQQPAFKRFFTPVQADLRAADDRCERLRLVIDWPMSLPAAEMDSVDHVLEPGAQQYTRALLEAIDRSAQ